MMASGVMIKKKDWAVPHFLFGIRRLYEDNSDSNAPNATSG